MNKTTMILRHSSGERCNHWLMALCFFLTALSGLPFFHPAFFWLTGLFGGGTWARILHPFFGVATALFFLLLVVRVWKDNRISAADWQWAMRLPDVMRNKTDNLPELGKYNFCKTARGLEPIRARFGTALNGRINHIQSPIISSVQTCDRCLS